MSFRILIISLFLFSFSCKDSSDTTYIFSSLNTNEFSSSISKENALVIDVRTDQEISKGYIKGATLIDFYSSNFNNKIQLLDKDMNIHIYCKSGGRSKKVAQLLVENGFKNIFNLDGGFDKWNSKGYPFVMPDQTLDSDEKNIENIINENYVDSIIKNNPTLVYISTKWCSPCRKMRPIVESLEFFLKNDINVIYIDADINPSLLSKFNSQSVPVLIFIENNIEQWRRKGVVSYDKLLNLINKEIL